MHWKASRSFTSVRDPQVSWAGWSRGVVQRERETWYDMIMSDFSDLKGRTVTCRAVQPRRRKVDHPLRQKPTGRAAEHPLARQFGVSCRDLGCFFIVFLL